MASEITHSVNYEDRAEKALANLSRGYNCSQAVACAFSDLTTFSEDEIKRLTSGCGMGMGSMEGTCGALCGAVVITNLLSTDKAQAFLAGRTITNGFLRKNGSVICKEIKGFSTGKALRSCQGCVEDSVILLLQCIAELQ